jgi:hypothetical protein
VRTSLCRAARAHSGEMVVKGFFSHSSFSGESQAGRVARYGYALKGCVAAQRGAPGSAPGPALAGRGSGAGFRHVSRSRLGLGLHGRCRPAHPLTPPPAVSGDPRFRTTRVLSSVTWRAYTTNICSPHDPSST